MFQELTHEGVCTEMLGGLQVVWVAQLTAGIVIWIALMLIPCVHAYHHEEKALADEAAAVGGEEMRL
jgi:hypothetical protein